MGGHGYTVVHATSQFLETEFVCISRPLERSGQNDGGPLNYRVKVHATLWENGKPPKLEVQILDGNPKFSI